MLAPRRQPTADILGAVETHAITLGQLSDSQRRDALESAAADLQAGRLVVFPTETVYGLAADGSTAGVEALARATGADLERDGPAAFSWHGHDGASLIEQLATPSAVARRLLSKLLPGPVHFVLEQPGDVLDEIRARLGVPKGAIDNGREITIRVPEHTAARELIELAGGPIVATRLDAAGWSSRTEGGRLVGDSPHGDDTPSCVLDDGPTKRGRVSTAVRVGLDGRFEVGADGAVDERFVLAALERTVLFVCTGNTCRSPMAAAIAAGIMAGRPANGITTRFDSAGVSAGEGIGATREAVEAAAALGGDLSNHGSKMLTAAMIADAEMVYAMTPSHAELAIGLAPQHAGKIYPLDPMGLVPDPIGQSGAVYRDTAGRLRELVAARIEELEP